MKQALTQALRHFHRVHSFERPRKKSQEAATREGLLYMLNLPRTYNRKVLGGVSILLVLFFLLVLSPRAPTSTPTNSSIVYVDSRTGLVLHDFDPDSPKKPQINQGHDPYPETRAKATFVSLARNSELQDLVAAIRNVEDKFNRKFKYDWVFLNDEPFTEEFKELTKSVVSGEAKYGLVPKEHWGYPDWIDQEKAAKTREDMKKANIIYGDSESYRHMCRFQSGFFFRHPLMEDYEWYWRVEPGIRVHCDLEYDLFRFMEKNNKVYGFTISIHEFEATIPTLWKHTKDFMKLHPEYLADNNLMKFISEDGGETYNLCHFWSNFEVASLKFLRSQAYMDYFEYLDKQGGFFYERWGDAPVHSIAAALFLPQLKVHFFSDVGYTHGVYTQCPLNDQFRIDNNCDCKPDSDFTFRSYSCGNQYYAATGLEKPKEWIHFQ